MGGIFSEKVDMSLSAASLIGLCLFTLLFEYCADALEEAFEHAPHYTDMIQKVWRELMILGFISLMVVMANEFSLIHDHTLFIAFEFAHLLIFGVSMFYTLTAVVTANRLAYTERQWKRIANLDTNTLVDRLEERLKERADDDNHWSGFAPLWQSLLLDMVKVVDRWEDGEWKMCRLMFLREFGLGNEFDYSKYLKLRLHHKLGHSLHVHPTTWMLVCLSAFLFYIGSWIRAEEDPADAGDAAVAAGSSLADMARDVITQQNNTNATNIEEETGGKLSETESVLVIVVPAVLGWLLLGLQSFVLYKVKAGIHKMLQLKGLKNVHDLPEYLRKLNAEVEMKYQIPRMWVFAESGDEFVEVLMSNMTLKFFFEGDVISEAGSELSKMIVFGHGECDVKGKDGKVLGQLGQGDYIGEASLLRNEPQTTSVVAKGDVTVFELERSALPLMKDEYPAAIQRILLFGEQKYKSKFGHNPPPDDGVLGAWMTELNAIQREMHLEAAAIMAKTMAAKAQTGIRKRAAAAGKAAMMATFKTAKDATKRAVKAAGLPGSGHGVEHGHGDTDRMTGADEIMTRHQAHFFEEISEIALLFNCFTLAYWLMHLMPVTIPTYFQGIFPTIMTHVAVLLPALLLMQEISPVTTKYFCVLETMLEKDQDLIGEVFQHMNRVNAQKNAIKKQLQEVGAGLARDVGLNAEDVDILALADLMFKEVDLDGGGTLSHKELRQGLNAFGIYLSKHEYRAIMEIIDPDMDGDITKEEWVDFLTASDAQLESNEWRAYKAIMNVRKRLASELVKRAMNMKEIMEGVDAAGVGVDSDGDGSMDITGLMGVIFESMDTDGDGALSDQEFRDGLFKFGIQMTEHDLDLVSMYINEEGTGGELTLEQFREFLHEEERFFEQQVLPGGKKGKQNELAKQISRMWRAVGVRYHPSDASYRSRCAEQVRSLRNKRQMMQALTQRYQLSRYVCSSLPPPSNHQPSTTFGGSLEIASLAFPSTVYCWLWPVYSLRCQIRSRSPSSIHLVQTQLDGSTASVATYDWVHRIGR
jgi:Ca2+-binding EF-hand superfamily protein